MSRLNVSWNLLLVFFPHVLQQTFFPIGNEDREVICILANYFFCSRKCKNWKHLQNYFKRSETITNTKTVFFRRVKNELHKMWWKMSVSTYLNSSLEEQLKFWWTIFFFLHAYNLLLLKISLSKNISFLDKAFSWLDLLTFVFKRRFWYSVKLLLDLSEIFINVQIEDFTHSFKN